MAPPRQIAQSLPEIRVKSGLSDRLLQELCSRSGIFRWIEAIRNQLALSALAMAAWSVGYAAALDRSVATGEAFDGIGEKFPGAGERSVLVPGAEVGQREEPWGKSAYSKVAFRDKRVASV